MYARMHVSHMYVFLCGYIHMRVFMHQMIHTYGEYFHSKTSCCECMHVCASRNVALLFSRYSVINLLLANCHVMACEVAISGKVTIESARQANSQIDVCMDSQTDVIHRNANFAPQQV